MFGNDTPLSTSDGSGSDNTNEWDEQSAVVFCVLTVILIIIGLAGHVTLLLSIAYHEELHNRPLNILIANLSVAQFLTLVIPVLGDIVLMLHDGAENHQPHEVVLFLALVFPVTASIFYGLIALNRFFSTFTENFYAHWSKTLCWSMVVIAWLLSILGSSFPWISSQVIFGRDQFFRTGFPWFTPSEPSSGLFWFLMTAYFFVPGMSLAIIFTFVIIKSFQLQRSAGPALNSPRAVTLRDRFRVVLMLLVCSVKHLVFYLATFIYWKATDTISQRTSFFFLWLVCVQNVLDPFIFGLVQPQFREAYVRILVWIIRRRSCRNSYGDSRVVPTIAGSDYNMRHPSVTFHTSKSSAPPSLLFHQTSVADAGNYNRGPSASSKRANGNALPNGEVSKDMRSQEVSASRTSDS